MIETKNKKHRLGKGVMIIYIILFLQYNYLFFLLSIPRGSRLMVIVEVILLILYLMVNSNVVKRIYNMTLSGRYVLYFCICSFLSVISCYIYRGQPIFDSLKGILPFQILLFYFVLFKNEVSEKQLIRFFLVIALCKFAILLFQQFTYPTFWFNAYKEGDISNYGVSYRVEIRSGIYRFLLGMIYILYFAGFYLTYFYLTRNNKVKYILLFGCVVIGIYFEQFRYNMFLFLLCWLWLNYRSRKSKITLIQILGVLIPLYALYANFDILFGALVERTDTEVTDKYMRFIGAYFYLFEYWKGPLTVLFGNGYPVENSGYWKEIIYFEQNNNNFRVDIGLIGTVNIYGFLFFLIFMLYIYKLCKNWKYIDMPMKAYLLWLAGMLPLFMPIHYSVDTNFFMAGLFYLIDKSVLRNKKLSKCLIVKSNHL